MSSDYTDDILLLHILISKGRQFDVGKADNLYLRKEREERREERRKRGRKEGKFNALFLSKKSTKMVPF